MSFTRTLMLRYQYRHNRIQLLKRLLPNCIDSMRCINPQTFLWFVINHNRWKLIINTGFISGSSWFVVCLSYLDDSEQILLKFLQKYIILYVSSYGFLWCIQCCVIYGNVVSYYCYFLRIYRFLG